MCATADVCARARTEIPLCNCNLFVFDYQVALLSNHPSRQKENQMPTNKVSESSAKSRILKTKNEAE